MNRKCANLTVPSLLPEELAFPSVLKRRILMVVVIDSTWAAHRVLSPQKWICHWGPLD